MEPPKLRKQIEKTKAKCKTCDKVIRPGDIVLDYVSSSYGGSINTRATHLSCVFDTAPKDCEFEAVMMIMAAGGKNIKNKEEGYCDEPCCSKQNCKNKTHRRLS